MANHKSAKKRIRQNAKRRLRNRFRKTTMKMMVKRLRGMEDKAEATELLPQVVSTVDKAAKANIIHKNTASNMKSKLTKHVNALS